MLHFHPISIQTQTHVKPVTASRPTDLPLLPPNPHTATPFSELEGVSPAPSSNTHTSTFRRKGLTFSSLAKKQHRATHDINIIVKILSTPPHQRCVTDIDQLVDFFEQFQILSPEIDSLVAEDTFRAFIAGTKYKHTSQNSYVFKEGDIANEFYFVLRGEAEIYECDDKYILDYGNIFGEPAMFDHERNYQRSTWCRAISNHGLKLALWDRNIYNRYILPIEMLPVFKSKTYGSEHNESINTSIYSSNYMQSPLPRHAHGQMQKSAQHSVTVICSVHSSVQSPMPHSIENSVHISSIPFPVEKSMIIEDDSSLVTDTHTCTYDDPYVTVDDEINEPAPPLMHNGVSIESFVSPKMGMFHQNTVYDLFAEEPPPMTESFTPPEIHMASVDNVYTVTGTEKDSEMNSNEMSRKANVFTDPSVNMYQKAQYAQKIVAIETDNIDVYNVWTACCDPEDDSFAYFNILYPILCEIFVEETECKSVPCPSRKDLELIVVKFGGKRMKLSAIHYPETRNYQMIISSATFITFFKWFSSTFLIVRELSFLCELGCNLYISTEECEAKLNKEPQGTFMLRLSNIENIVILSYRRIPKNKKRCKHIDIIRTDADQYQIVRSKDGTIGTISGIVRSFARIKYLHTPLSLYNKTSIF